MKNKLMLMIGLVLIFSFIFTGMLEYEQGTDIDIQIPCINNGTYCSGSSQCNITIKYPNTTVWFNNVEMTNQGSYHNLSINRSYTNVKGIYPSSVVCADGNYNGYSVFDFEIRPNIRVNGLNMMECDLSSTGQSIAIIGIIIIMIGLWLLCFYLKIPILSIMGGFVFLYFAWYVAKCFMFANVLFIIMGFIQLGYGIKLATEI